MRIKQSIVIPAFNEARRLGTTLDTVMDYARKGSKNAWVSEVIVVCDGCSDATERVARGYTDRMPLRVVSYADNRGKGHAVRQGIAASKGDVVAFMDADGATPVSELGRLSDPIIHGQADIVIGSRRVKDARVKVDQPVVRQLLGRAFALHAQVVLGLNIQDTQCGFKVFKGPLARALFKDMQCDGFAFDLEILAFARERHLRVLERGVEWNERSGSTVHPLRDGVRMLRAAWKIRSRLHAQRHSAAAESQTAPLLSPEPLYSVSST